jgi:hypothetical protein
MYFDPRGDQRAVRFEALQPTWFNAFFQLLTENCKPEQLEQRFAGLTLIIFNYDRCVEHFLFHALQNYYGVSPERSAALLKSLAIYHPYGSVGHLPWQEQNGAVDFGAEQGSKGVLALAQQIRTFTEGTDPKKSDIENIRTRLLDSQIVMFLGFAYHRLNLQLLRADGVVHTAPAETKYFGTGFGLSDTDCAEIGQELTVLGGAPLNQIHVRKGLTCTTLFGEYWRSLSLARFA